MVRHHKTTRQTTTTHLASASVDRCPAEVLSSYRSNSWLQLCCDSSNTRQCLFPTSKRRSCIIRSECNVRSVRRLTLPTLNQRFLIHAHSTPTAHNLLIATAAHSLMLMTNGRHGLGVHSKVTMNTDVGYDNNNVITRILESINGDYTIHTDTRTVKHFDN